MTLLGKRSTRQYPFRHEVGEPRRSFGRARVRDDQQRRGRANALQLEFVTTAYLARLRDGSAGGHESPLHRPAGIGDSGTIRLMRDGNPATPFLTV